MSPKVNRERALFVLGKIDEILAWEQMKGKRPPMTVWTSV